MFIKTVSSKISRHSAFLLHTELQGHVIFAAMQAINGISVVIPNYNGEMLLPQILPTVFIALKNISIPSEIIVSDDCSIDRSAEIIKENFSQVKFLQSTTNNGFSITANSGIKAALYNWVLLLNSDVKLEPDYFMPLLKYAAKEKVFGVMGRIIGWDDEQIQDGAKYPFFHGVKIKTSGNYLLKNTEEMKEGIFTMYLSGANAFLNKKIFLDIGGFNEMFSPFYVEDFELSLRAWRLGYVCYFDYSAVCRHKTSSTVASSQKRKQVKKIYNRNKMFLHAIHLSAAKRKLWFVQLFAECLLHLFTLRVSFIESVYQFMCAYKKVKKSRNRLNELGQKKLLSVNQVADKILNAIKDKSIKKF